jgi:septal ring factor EnvC (AmiA/AmiB activator)
LAHLKAKIGSSFAAETESPSPRLAAAPAPSIVEMRQRPDERLDQALAEIATLKMTVADLQTKVAALEDKLKAIAEALGM